MSVSILSCPSCQTLVLSDTAQCPNCQLILEPERMAEVESLAADRPAPKRRAEEPCPKCGEMVRKGLVRCWNCGEFMRGDIAEVYEQMQATDSPVIYSRIPANEVSVKSAPAAVAADEESASALYAHDEDFELSPEFSLQQAQAQPARGAANGAAQQSATDPAAAAEGEPGDQGPPSRSEEPEVPHSVATGGDVLLQVALQEEAESGKRPRGARRGPRALRGFLVYCPNGHRIEVQEQHRGRGGRCPRCKAPFYVPLREELPPAAAATGDAPAGAAGQTALVAGQYTRWLADVHFHAVNPQKLKLKPGSLQNEFAECEVGFSPEGMVAVTLVRKKGGLFGGGDQKKKGAAREAVLEHLREGKPLDKLPAAGQRFFSAEHMRQAGLAQPFPYAHESLFAGIPVFGDGRIAVKFPKADDKPELHYASFALTQFREFAAAMAEFYGVEELGAEFGVPLKDQFVEMTCHYSDEKLQVLQHLEFYKADPGIKLKLIGRKCQACGLVVSEESRKKEKIGGANGKGIAKAKCPKCKQKFGDISLFSLEAPADEEKEAKAEEKKDDNKETPAEPAAAS